MAAKYGHKDTVECLVDGGADSKAKDINGVINGRWMQYIGLFQIKKYYLIIFGLHHCI